VAAANRAQHPKPAGPARERSAAIGGKVAGDVAQAALRPAEAMHVVGDVAEPGDTPPGEGSRAVASDSAAIPAPNQHEAVVVPAGLSDFFERPWNHQCAICGIWFCDIRSNRKFCSRCRAHGSRTLKRRGDKWQEMRGYDKGGAALIAAYRSAVERIGGVVNETTIREFSKGGYILAFDYELIMEGDEDHWQFIDGNWVYVDEPARRIHEDPGDTKVGTARAPKNATRTISPSSVSTGRE
jgi:hypothetical protein